MTGRAVTSSEVRAYHFIKEELKGQGWDVRNPARHPKGRVYTQNECLSHPEIKKQLGQEKPENVVKISDTTYWVIEAKSEHRLLPKATSEAKEYARKINKSQNIQAPFISGIAGDEEDGFFVETMFLVNQKFRHITSNGRNVTGLISPGVAKIVLESGPDIKDVPVDEALFLSKAERINEILHLGAINKSYRALVMSALLLALLDDTPPNVDAGPSVLIGDINGRAKKVLRSQKKESFYQFIELKLPATEDNHNKYKTALVQTIQELNNLNIRSAMNSGTDVLGKFYEVFLKYGNGAKEIGIVLTPRHITKFAVEVLHISDRDTVYDPCCGTGGFLVAALDHVRIGTSPEAVNRFKCNNIFGVDQDTEVVALAITNMIFRGDGKNNIIEGDCFQKNIFRSDRGAKYSSKAPTEDQKAVTRVLMNPPFPTRTGQVKEYQFVDCALGQMQDGGLLFSVLPYPTMVKTGGYRRWRESLLRNNTLLCVMTFPEDLFYPVGAHTLGLFVTKGLPHPEGQNVLWVRALNDGLVKSKGKRLPNPSAKDDFSGVKSLIKAFLVDPSIPVENEEQIQKACPIDFTDPLLELVPEKYLDQLPPNDQEIQEGIEKVIRDSVAFLIQENKEDE